jgi:hypothetical protein
MDDLKEQRTYHQELITLHHDEVELLNARLQALLVATAFLIGSYAQFRNNNVDIPRGFLLRISVCVFGLSLAAVLHNVLGRTSRAIWWYITQVVEMEKQLYGTEYSPYLKRRLQRSESKWRTSHLLGQWIPRGIIVLWSVLFASNFYHWWAFALALVSTWFYSLLLLKILGVKRRSHWVTSVSA